MRAAFHSIHREHFGFAMDATPVVAALIDVEAFGDGACASVSVAAAVDEAHIEFESAATYLITGGLGAIGLRIAAGMVARGARRIVLLGRTALPPRTSWSSDKIASIIIGP